MPAQPAASIQKKVLREAAIARRLALDEALRRRLDEAIAAHLAPAVEALAPRVLGFCWPHLAEPDLAPWVGRWLAAAHGRRAALPVVVARGAPMVFRGWAPGTPLLPDRHGIPHPPEGPALHPDLVLIPVNAFDARGFRIGYGGGYFDRTLAALRPRPAAIGYGYECARIADALPEAHDLPMSAVVTEAGLWRPAGTAG